MGSYDIYDYAHEDRFDTPSSLPSILDLFWRRVTWRVHRALRRWAPRFERYLREVEERRAPKRYARWRNRVDKRWRARLPRTIERPAISLNSKTAEQFQSRFFQLPLEVREEIYGYIFDGATVRLDAQEKAADGNVARSKEPYRIRSLEPQQRFAILQACKRTYLEAAHLLYTTHTFIFSDLTTFLCFHNLVPSYHFHRIKSIGIAWDYQEVPYDFQYDHLPCPTNEQTWKEVCGVVAKMEGLEYLRVDLACCPMSPYHDSDLDLARPLRDITQPRTFEYFVYGKKKELPGTGADHESDPFDQSSLDYESESESD